MRLLLDTNILIDVLHSNASTIGVLAEATRGGYELTTSAIVVAEVYAGIRKGEERRTWELMDGLVCMPVSQPIAKRGGEIKVDWARRGITLALTDSLIAATALEHHLLLVTKNRKHFPTERLAFYPAP